MSELPTDLVPLPTAPYDERPVELPLDIEECRTALWMKRGNISEAAKLIKTSPARFRRFVQSSPRLMEEVKEAQQQLVDMAEDVAYEALTDEDPSRRDSMARFVMSNLGKDRGYGTANGGGVNVNLPKGRIRIEWADGSSLSAESMPDGPPEKVIEGSLAG